MTPESFEDPGSLDDWAATYDRDVRGRDDFPFLGYDVALNAVVLAVGPKPPCSVLDLGIGTGNLAKRFADLGCEVWGLDFSPRMLARAAGKVPGAHVAEADLLGDWPAAFRRRFDVVVSAYVLHHFTLEAKIALLRRVGRDHCAPGGRMVIADLSFPAAAALARARERWRHRWDEEHYWIAEEAVPACEDAGLGTRYEQVSEIAGVYVFTPPLLTTHVDSDPARSTTG
jgi:putative AdoMet-dependent methyltransferase